MGKPQSWKLILAILSLNVLSPLLAFLPAQANNCRPLTIVGNNEVEIRKQIDGRPGGIIVRNNWNTDFTVPSGVRFSYYSILITAENDAGYDVSINFKYPNNTSDTVFRNNNVDIYRSKPWQVDLQSPTGRQPYQVNLRIGGTRGNVYRARVFACR